MADVTIAPVDPLDPAQDGLFRAWHAAATASAADELGDRETVWSVEEVRGRQRETKDLHTYLAAVDADGVVVGAAWLTMPTRDNLHAASVELDVVPGRRREGIGSLLLTEVERRAREAGRRTLTLEGIRRPDSEDRQTPFTRAHGYAVGLVNLRSDLDLPGGAADLDRVLAPIEREAGAPSGYRLLTWWDGVPEEWLDQRAALAARMSTDAPMGDLEVEPEVWDAERLREQTRLIRAQGRRIVETVAVHEATGRAVAFTDLAVAQHTPTTAYQWDTLVLSEHRGHRLGMAVKAANLRALLAGLPDVRRVVTFNAASNAPMLRVNRAMGFEVVGTLTQWHKDLRTA